MKKMIFLITVAFMAMPMIASADLVGDCYDCHTMHNSEQGSAVIATAQPNLLRFDCLGCHAVAPTTGTKNYNGAGGSIIPQVAHSGADGVLAGGNFNQPAGTQRNMHSVVDIVDAGIAAGENLGDIAGNAPPGITRATSTHSTVFTSEGSTQAFDMFTCAGARGCHGTRSQALVASSQLNATGQNEWVIESRRTGLAAISGAHHNNIDGVAKTSTGYDNLPAAHDGQVVADGYRFIVGLQGYENYAREFVNGDDHNEYYGNTTPMGAGCGACHVQDLAQENTRAGLNSGIVSINNSMSGFCSSCHGNFHSTGGADGQANNGSSGAFLRHPSDYVLPGTGDYAAYTRYVDSAPVARPTVLSSADANVNAGDMVMCLSCHVAHGSANEYMLRFNYDDMYAGAVQDEDASLAIGGCLACHSSKGSAPGSRIR